MKKLLVILGPTATGKTDLALILAKKYNGELVAADSRQVYCGLDIGAGKLPSGRWKIEDGKWKKGKGFWEIGGVKIWMYDVVDPKIQYTVADYVRNASKVVDEISSSGKLPIIVGGTGLYIKALLEGLPNLSVPMDKKLRRELEKLTVEELQEKLKKLYPSKWNKLNESDRRNPRRLLRSIELVLMNGYVDTRNKRYVMSDNYNLIKIGLTAPREVLYEKVDQRVLLWMDLGLIVEAENLRKSGLTLKRMRQLGLEYGVLADYLSGEIREIEGDKGLIKIMQGKIHGYVRRQLTWFKKEKDIKWFDIAQKNYPKNVESEIDKWYHSIHDAAN